MLKPTTQQNLRKLATLLVFALLSNPLCASDAIQRIPDNALGFVVVRDLAQTSQKADRLIQQFQITFPAPLAFIKIATGLESGLDLSGDLVIALMPGEGRNASPVPMVLLPISDYAAFADSISADPSGEVCRAAILGIDILVAKDGPYAMLMNVEHRQTMEALVGLKAEPIAQLQPIADWLESNDIALVLMQPSIQQLGNWRPAPNVRRNRHLQFGVNNNRPPLWPSTDLIRSFVPQILAWQRANFKLSAVGLTLDDQQNLRLSKQFVPLDNSHLAELTAQLSQRPAAQLNSLADQVVLSGGGPLFSNWGDKLATFLHESEQRDIITNGLENVSPELWKQSAQAYQSLFATLQSCSVVMLAGETGEPLVGNFLGVATVPDVTTYFDQLDQITKTWNEISSQATNDIQLKYEVDSRTISGQKARELVVDVAAAANDPNVPIMNWLFEALLGRDGKFRLKFVEITPTTFAFGLATDDQLTKLITATKTGESSTPASAATTLKLLNEKAPWKFVVSPQGCSTWATRVVNEFLVHIGWQAVETPPMPDSPPLGISVELVEGVWQGEIVCPAATLQTVADYLEARQED